MVDEGQAILRPDGAKVKAGLESGAGSSVRQHPSSFHPGRASAGKACRAAARPDGVDADSSGSEGDDSRPLMERASRLASQKRAARTTGPKRQQQLRDKLLAVEGGGGGENIIVRTTNTASTGRKRAADTNLDEPGRPHVHSSEEDAPLSSGSHRSGAIPQEGGVVSGGGRGRRAAVPSSPECCIAFGCGRPMDYWRDRNPRQKVCHEHQQAERVALTEDNSEGWQRYCQRCARFHPLSCFDDVKRSCRTSLEMHNLRRRRNRAAAGAKSHNRSTNPATTTQQAKESPSSDKQRRVIDPDQNLVVCQVDDCGTLLGPNDSVSSRRYRTCAVHQQALRVAIGGDTLRFCQQCGRFHALSEFDCDKHSCRASLESHNHRRRRLRVSSADDGTATLVSNLPSHHNANYMNPWADGKPLSQPTSDNLFAMIHRHSAQQFPRRQSTLSEDSSPVTYGGGVLGPEGTAGWPPSSWSGLMGPPVTLRPPAPMFDWQRPPFSVRGRWAPDPATIWAEGARMRPPFPMIWPPNNNNPPSVAELVSRHHSGNLQSEVLRRSMAEWSRSESSPPPPGMTRHISRAEDNKAPDLHRGGGGVVPSLAELRYLEALSPGAAIAALQRATPHPSPWQYQYHSMPRRMSLDADAPQEDATAAVAASGLPSSTWPVAADQMRAASHSSAPSQQFKPSRHRGRSPGDKLSSSPPRRTPSPASTAGDLEEERYL